VKKYLLDWLKTKIKYLLFGLKTKFSPKILFLPLKKFVFIAWIRDTDWTKKTRIRICKKRPASRKHPCIACEGGAGVQVKWRLVARVQGRRGVTA